MSKEFFNTAPPFVWGTSVDNPDSLEDRTINIKFKNDWSVTVSEYTPDSVSVSIWNGIDWVEFESTKDLHRETEPDVLVQVLEFVRSQEKKV